MTNKLLLAGIFCLLFLSSCEMPPDTIKQYTITVTASPSYAGIVTLNPNISTFGAGSQVTLTATPNNGYEFVNWTGAASGTTNPVVVTADKNQTITANFTNPNGIWNTIVNGFSFNFSSGSANITTVSAMQINQDGYFSGDFSMTLAFSKLVFDSRYGHFKLYSAGFYAEITDYSFVELNICTNNGTKKTFLPVFPYPASGTFTISRIGSDVTVSYNISGNIDSVTETGFTGDLGVSIYASDGGLYHDKCRVSLDDFAVTGGGGAIQSDDFSINRIK
jgi:uncharacterized repeat protein (TIGR02543 family)